MILLDRPADRFFEGVKALFPFLLHNLGDLGLADLEGIQGIGLGLKLFAATYADASAVAKVNLAKS